MLTQHCTGQLTLLLHQNFDIQSGPNWHPSIHPFLAQCHMYGSGIPHINLCMMYLSAVAICQLPHHQTLICGAKLCIHLSALLSVMRMEANILFVCKLYSHCQSVNTSTSHQTFNILFLNWHPWIGTIHTLCISVIWKCLLFI